MVTPFDADGGLDEDAAGAPDRATCSITGPTAWWWPAPPARAPRSPTTRRCACGRSAVAESRRRARDRRHGHQRHPAHRGAHRAGQPARGGRRAGGHALLQQAQPRGPGGALTRPWPTATDLPVDALQHPVAVGDRHAQRPARRAGADPERQRRQAGPLRGPRADRRARPARRQRRRAGRRARHGRHRRDPRGLAPRGRGDAPDRSTSPTRRARDPDVARATSRGPRRDHQSRSRSRLR